MSLSVLDREGYHINIRNCSLYLYNGNNILLTICPLINGHYILDTTRDILNAQVEKRKRSEFNNTELWNIRLGHIGVRRLSRLVKDGLIQNLTIEPYQTCECCIQRKMTKASFQGVGHRTNDLLELIHSDVCGPMNHTAHETCFL